MGRAKTNGGSWARVVPRNEPALGETLGQPIGGGPRGSEHETRVERNEVVLRNILAGFCRRSPHCKSSEMGGGRCDEGAAGKKWGGELKRGKLGQGCA